MHGVACSAINDWRIGNVFTIVDHDCPDVDEHEERNVRELLKRQDEWEYVVWDRLCEAIERMESMRREWRGHDPFVVRLVEVLVDAWVMEPSVNPVNEEVGKQQENRELQDVIPPARPLFRRVVDLAVSSDLEPKCSSCQDSHARQGLQSLPYFHANLILEILGMLEGLVIEDEVIGEASEGEVQNRSKNPGDHE